MKKRGFVRNNSEKKELMQRITWLKRDVENKTSIIKRLLRERNERNEADKTERRFEIYMICNSYESGFGHGIANDGLDLSKTPHSDQYLGEAYQIGYEAGCRRYKEAQHVDK